MSMILTFILLIFSNNSPSLAYLTFQTRIPNGDKVPDPCQAGSIWPGVGHRMEGGSGTLNPFGVNFASNQYNWTAICPLDSDGDGRTNGQELGDPNCTWKIGMTPLSSSNITHPGICEPTSSPSCGTFNSWLTCPTPFDCPAINESDVRTIELRIPLTPVPADETTYMCFGFVLPNNTDYHVIATTPINNNSLVLHHMLLYACESEITDVSIFNTPRLCGMTVNNCNSLIGLWGAGSTGQCLSSEYGYHIGPRGFKHAIMQFHWNNPGHRTDYVDSSGMTLYITPNLRANDGEVLIVGQTGLVIPPNVNSVTFQGSCTPYCSSALPQSVNMAEIVLHMHLLGQSGDVQLYRNGSSIRVLANVTRYEYNNPRFETFPSTIALQPGDEIRVHCTYSSLGKTSTTYYGEGTSDEMCFAFIPYYPSIKNFNYCGQYKTAEVCSNQPVNCDMDAFQLLSQSASTVCKLPSCTRLCQLFMMTLVETGCLTGDIGDFLSRGSNYMTMIRNMISWCQISTNTSTTSAISSSINPTSCTTSSTVEKNVTIGETNSTAHLSSTVSSFTPVIKSAPASVVMSTAVGLLASLATSKCL